ncbi:MarR family winged helix-turn-helix transcriptional regulator [Crocinitomix algicola]|uniref:MarR family winged helix-turn-helix transcriptional regulator n=1 Tax=Crocinitomix algicola TaxID=1740263 RepID=UPI000836BBBD|nr:MarR family transcriptional regulator [Crocinitomix algicola]
MKQTEFPELYLKNQLCFPLYATSRLTTKIYTPFLKSLDITYPQYLVLMALWENNNQRVNSIGERLFLESNTLTPLLKRLEKKGLIERKRSSKDERTVVISLTKKGTTLKKKASEVPAKILSSFQDNTISEQEIVIFQQTLFKLLNILGNKTKGI